MNKKNNRIRENWYFILIPIFIVLLSFAEIHYLNKPDYIITKEVCGNQEILIPDNLTLIGYTEEPFVSEFEVNISNPDFKVKYKFIGQVCETQEVDSIEVIKLNCNEYDELINEINKLREKYHSLNLSENIIKIYELKINYLERSISYNKEWCLSLEDDYNYNISKKDLTKEWLKENCECIDKPYGMSVCKWDVPDDCIIDRSITGLYTVNSSRPECLNCGQEDVFPEDCTKFKCGEYQVEVLR